MKNEQLKTQLTDALSTLDEAVSLLRRYSAMVGRGDANPASARARAAFVSAANAASRAQDGCLRHDYDKHQVCLACGFDGRGDIQ